MIIRLHAVMSGLMFAALIANLRTLSLILVAPYLLLTLVMVMDTSGVKGTDRRSLP